MKKWCPCGRNIPNKDTYCEDCNIKFYNLNKKVATKKYNKMIDETETPVETPEKEEEVSTEADKATETSE